MSVLYVVQYAQSRRQQSDDNSDASTSRLIMIPHCSVSQSAVMSDVGSNSCAVTPQRADSPSLCASYASTDEVSLLQHSTVSDNSPVTPRRADSSLDACSVASSYQVSIGSSTPKSTSSITATSATPSASDKMFSVVSAAKCYQFLLRGDIADDLE